MIYVAASLCLEVCWYILCTPSLGMHATAMCKHPVTVVDNIRFMGKLCYKCNT